MCIFRSDRYFRGFIIRWVVVRILNYKIEVVSWNFWIKRTVLKILLTSPWNVIKKWTVSWWDGNIYVQFIIYEQCRGTTYGTILDQYMYNALSYYVCLNRYVIENSSGGVTLEMKPRRIFVLDFWTLKYGIICIMNIHYFI